MQQHTVFLIPSDDLRWTALRTALQELQEVSVVGEAANATQAIAMIATLRPDIVIAAEAVGDAAARTFLTELRRTCCPTTRLIVCAARFDPADVLPFAQIGLAAYLPWSELSRTTLPACLVTLLESDLRIGSKAAVDVLIAVQREPSATPSTSDAPPARELEATAYCRLTTRQREVLRLVEIGLSNRQIAQHLTISPSTVKRHIENSRQILGVHDRATAARVARECHSLD